MLWQDIEGKKQSQNIHPQPTELTEGKQPSLCSLPIILPPSVKGTAKGNGLINTTWLSTSLQVGWSLEPRKLGTHPEMIHISEKSTGKILNGMQKVFVI